MSSPLITAALFTYRRPELLKRAIKSVLQQREERFVLKVYDDASLDETARVVDSFQDPRILYIEQPRNGGAIKQVTQALSEIQTPYCYFCADDDFPLPHLFERALLAFKHYPEAAFYASRTLPNPPKAMGSGYFPKGSVQYLLRHGFFNITALCFRSAALQTLEAIDPKSAPCFDNDWELQLALHFPFFFENIPGGGCAPSILRRSPLQLPYKTFCRDIFSWKSDWNASHLPREKSGDAIKAKRFLGFG